MLIKSWARLVGDENPDPRDYDWAVGSDQTNTIHAETIKEFRAGVEHKSCDETSFGRVKYQWVESASDILDFMAKARSSKHSYLNQRYFMDLPVSVLSGDMERSLDEALKRDAAQGKTLQDYTKLGALIHLRKFKIQGHTMTFYDADNEYDYVVKELARGDVDGDGFEDALVMIGCHTQGTLGWSGTMIVTRIGPDQKIKVVDQESGQEK